MRIKNKTSKLKKQESILKNRKFLRKKYNNYTLLDKNNKTSLELEKNKLILNNINFLNSQNYVLGTKIKRKLLTKFFSEKIFRIYLYRGLDNFYYYLNIFFFLGIYLSFLGFFIFYLKVFFVGFNIIFLFEIIMFVIISYFITNPFYSFIKGIKKRNTTNLKSFLRTPYKLKKFSYSDYKKYIDEYNNAIYNNKDFKLKYNDFSIFTILYVLLIMFFNGIVIYLFYYFFPIENMIFYIFLFFLLFYIFTFVNLYSLIILLVYLLFLPFIIIFSFIYTFIFKKYKGYIFIKFKTNNNLIPVFDIIKNKYAMNDYFLVKNKK